MSIGRTISGVGTVLALGTSAVSGQTLDAKVSTYVQTREMPSVTLEWSFKDMPLGLSGIGFLDIEDFRGENPGTPYGEMPIASPKWNGLGVDVEPNVNLATGANTVRFGLSYRLPIDNALAVVRYFPVDTDDRGDQLKFFGKKEFESGFIEIVSDYNFEGNKWLFEPQVGYRIGDNLYAIFELSYNQFRNPETDHQLAGKFGFQFVF